MQCSRRSILNAKYSYINGIHVCTEIFPSIHYHFQQAWAAVCFALMNSERIPLNLNYLKEKNIQAYW